MQSDHQVVQFTPQASECYIQNAGETEKERIVKGWGAKSAGS